MPKGERNRKFSMYFYYLYKQGIKDGFEAKMLVWEIRQGHHGRAKFTRTTKESNGWAIWTR